jgi:hypothetical protein
MIADVIFAFAVAGEMVAVRFTVISDRTDVVLMVEGCARPVAIGRVQRLHSLCRMTWRGSQRRAPSLGTIV